MRGSRPMRGSGATGSSGRGCGKQVFSALISFFMDMYNEISFAFLFWEEPSNSVSCHSYRCLFITPLVAGWISYWVLGASLLALSLAMSHIAYMYSSFFCMLVYLSQCQKKREWDKVKTWRVCKGKFEGVSTLMASSFSASISRRDILFSNSLMTDCLLRPLTKALLHPRRSFSKQYPPKATILG